MGYRKGKIYCIEFLDHFVGCHDIPSAQVWGELYKQDSKALYVITWKIQSDDTELVEQNLEKITILKSTVIKYWELKKGTMKMP